MNAEELGRLLEQGFIKQGYRPDQAQAIVAILKTSHVPGRINNMSTCNTCDGTGRITERDPTDSAWFPKPARRRVCLDCGGTGRRAVVDDDEFILPGDERPDPPDED